MKIGNPNILKVESAGSDISSVEAGIDMDNLGFIFDIVSTQMYKDPIGSLVREVTSNCFDSHAKANVDTAVRIGGGVDDEGTFITFEDFGTGLSSRSMKKVYMKYFSSTKRNSNKEIGGFGLGSKSPLAYTDMFYIRSRYGGIETLYLLHKGEKVPTLEILSKQSTEAHNGVQIKVYLKNVNQYRFTHPNYDDSKFKFKLQEQLAYFDNVYIDSFWQIENKYNIYEGNYFKYRTGNQFGGMHICLGKVYYPIDWSELDLSYIAVPVAVKFEIGELQVTPNRESLRYNDEIKELVKERINLACEELKTLYHKQIPEITDFDVWLSYANKEPYVTIAEGITLNISSLEGVSKNIPFKPFAELGIEINPDNPYPEYYCDEAINYKFEIVPVNTSVKTLFRDGKKCIFQNKVTNKETNTYLGSTYMPKYDTSNFNRIFLIKRTEKSIDDYKKIIKFEKRSFGGGKPFITYAKRIYQYKKIMMEEIIKKSSRLLLSNDFLSLTDNDKFVTYKTVQPASDWLAEYKRKLREESAAYQRKLNKVISYKDFTIRRTTGTYEAKLENFLNNTKVIIYGCRDEESELVRVSDLLRFRKTLNDNVYNVHNQSSKVSNDEKKVKVMLISKSNYVLMKEIPGSCHVKDFYSNNRLFVDLATAFKIKDLLQGINIDKYEGISKFVHEKMVILKEHADKFDWASKSYSTNNFLNDYKDEVLKLAKARGLWDKDLVKTIDEVELWFTGVEFLKFTTINKDSEQHVVDALKKAKKKINYYWYNNQERIEIDVEQLTLGKKEHWSFLDDCYDDRFSINRKKELLLLANK